MKSMKKGLGLLLILAMQVFAQRFTAIEPDVWRAGIVEGYPPRYSGFFPSHKQIAALGEKNSAYANLMLLGGRDTTFKDGQKSVGTYNVVNSHGEILGIVHPFSAPNAAFTTPDGNEIHDNSATAIVVLDSLNDSKKTATVIFASLKKMVIMRIIMDSANNISFNILSRMDMPEFMWNVDKDYNVSQNIGTYTRRLALLGTSQNGADKVYHLATGNPYGKNGVNRRSGRVDFFDIRENAWAFLQPNIKGLASGENGLFFGEDTYFGKDLAVIDNFDRKGGKALAVLLPVSAQFPRSALYIFKMENDWTPGTELPTVIAGSSRPWLEEPRQYQDCGGLGIANWEDTPHLLVSCLIQPTASNIGDITSIAVIKNIVLDSTGNIVNSSIFSSEKISAKAPSRVNYYVYSNPIAIKNHKSDLYSISLAVKSSAEMNHFHSMAIFTIVDADASKNFSIEVGKSEAVVNPDSLFYKSGTSGFSVRTLFGLAQCGIQNDNLLCSGEENAIGSWSALEISSKSACDFYRECKRKDTVYVYVRSQKESPNTALRIPRDIVVAASEYMSFSSLKSLSYFKNPSLQNTDISWNAGGLKLSVAASNNPNELSIIPLPQREGIDTIVFNLSISANTNSYPVRIHIADTSKILSNGIPQAPSESDTVWNTVQKKYIALPRSNSNGNIYSYDITQDNLGAYAEITGDYLHILKIDVADIFIAYTENSQIKYRKVTLMPESRAFSESQFPNPNPIAGSPLAQSLSVVHVSGGLQINGLNGEFEIRAYNFKGVEIQREKANGRGSAFVKLKQNCPQVVQIKSGNRKVYVRVVN